MFYPLLFESIYKQRIWGGTKLKTVLHKDIPSDGIGESWELSTVENNVSRIANGHFQGRFFDEVLAHYPKELLGSSVVARFGSKLPLLFKFIDAKDDLSIQVHPNDELAMKRHNSFGKTEMWYVMQADNSSRLIVGFREKCSEKKYTDCLANASLPELLNEETVCEGDVFFIEPGTIHAIGKGVLLAEIQQSSDITYRIYDWERTDQSGNQRELHTNAALAAMNYDVATARIAYQKIYNQANQLVNCSYFTTNLIPLNGNFSVKNNAQSFRVYMCIDGAANVVYDDITVHIKKGGTVFIPAIIENFILSGNGQLLETYIT
jgi:mannose-6-phosphate isomerase